MAIVRPDFGSVRLDIFVRDDKDHMSVLWLKNTSESDPYSYVVT